MTTSAVNGTFIQLGPYQYNY